MKRKKPRFEGLSLIQTAVLRRAVYDEWSPEKTKANIHAIIGENSDELVNATGRVLYVVLGAALASDVDPEMVQIRIIRGAVNAMAEQVGSERITDQRRESIKAGLRAAGELVDVLPRKALADAAIELTGRLMVGELWTQDFENLLKKATP